MTLEDYAEMSAERLSPLFVDHAKRLGHGRLFGALGGVAPLDGSLTVEPHEVRKQAMMEILAIAAGLLAKPIGSECLALFDHPDPDVRMGASIYLNDADPDLAEATREGVMRGCSASEVTAARRRVRQPPPPRPTLQEMSDEALLTRFQDAGERLTACQFVDWVHDDRDMNTRNAIIDELIAIRAEAKRRVLLPRLVPFLDSPDPSIRHHAAIACLDFATDKAVATLEGLKADADPQVRAAAGWTLKRWRAKRDASTGSET
jgi:hypothetical protein